MRVYDYISTIGSLTLLLKRISIHFLESIYNSILVIVNTLLKYIYLELYREVSTIEDLVYIFNKVVITRHDILDRIILNRDKLFTLQF